MTRAIEKLRPQSALTVLEQEMEPASPFGSVCGPKGWGAPCTPARREFSHVADRGTQAVPARQAVGV